MNETIIKNINARCNKDDMLFHLGDFKYNKSTQADVAHKNPELLLNPKIIYIRGNHDNNNNLKGMLDFAMITFANTKYLLCHVPPPSEFTKYSIIEHMIPYVDCILCGHVHEKWKHKMYSKPIMEHISCDPIPVINVGVDVWGFKPVRIDEIHRYYQQIIKKK
jgi:calcineurin-like phosphoesterase family protein